MALQEVREEFDPAIGDIRFLLDLGLTVERDTKAPKQQSGWYASHLGYCLRRQFLERAGVAPTVPDDAPRRQFWLGQSIEWALIQRLKHAGILLADQLHVVSEAHHVSGYIDFIYGGHPVDDDPANLEGYSPEWIDYLVGYKKAIREAFPDGIPVTSVELKTANDYSLKKQYQDGPQFHNLMQGGLYEVVRDEHPEQFSDFPPVERAQLVVMGKSDAKMLVTEITDVHRQKVLARLDELNDAWPLELPPCTCGKQMSWEARYCPYRTPAGCCDELLIQRGSEEFWKLADAALSAQEGGTDG